MRIKRLLGLCEARRCFKKSEIEVDICAGEKLLKTARVCPECMLKLFITEEGEQNEINRCR